MIVGKALKNDQELKYKKGKEVDFAKKYQMLSKNTALFAEILNDGENNQTKLIKVNLNEYEGVRSANYFSKMPTGCSKGSTVTRAKSRMETSSANYKAFKSYKSNNVIMNRSMKKAENKNEIKDEDDLIRLIMSQDIIIGAWNENKETKKIINIVTRNIFNKIDNKVKLLKKGEQEIKIIYTLLVIYYLNSKHKDKLNDFKLVINKGKKYLMNIGIKYEDFMVGI